MKRIKRHIMSESIELFLAALVLCGAMIMWLGSPNRTVDGISFLLGSVAFIDIIACGLEIETNVGKLKKKRMTAIIRRRKNESFAEVDRFRR